MKCKYIILVILLNFKVMAQNHYDSGLRPVHSINLNVLGDASIISINYDRQIFLNKNFFLSAKIGTGSQHTFFNEDSRYFQTFPHHLTANYGSQRHFFEFGLGGNYVLGRTERPYIFYPTIGYRLQPLKSGRFNFRVFNQFPFININRFEDYVYSFIGVSVGVSFL